MLLCCFVALFEFRVDLSEREYSGEELYLAVKSKVSINVCERKLVNRLKRAINTVNAISLKSIHFTEKNSTLHVPLTHLLNNH